MDEHFVLTPWKGGSCQPPKVKNDPIMLTEILFDSLENLEISRFAALSKAFWLRMVSMAIAVLPVCRSPMISSRCPRPMGIRLSTAFKPVVLTVSQWLLFEVNIWGLLGKKCEKGLQRYGSDPNCEIWMMVKKMQKFIQASHCFSTKYILELDDQHTRRLCILAPGSGRWSVRFFQLQCWW